MRMDIPTTARSQQVVLLMVVIVRAIVIVSPPVFVASVSVCFIPIMMLLPLKIFFHRCGLILRILRNYSKIGWITIIIFFSYRRLLFFVHVKGPITLRNRLVFDKVSFMHFLVTRFFYTDSCVLLHPGSVHLNTISVSFNLTIP